MPLAGRMKLRSFLVMMGAGLLVLLGVVGGGAWWLGREAGDAVAERRQVAQAQQERLRDAQAKQVEAMRQAREARPAAVPQPAAADPAVQAVDVPTGRAVDDVVMRYLAKPLGTTKRKDVSKGQAFKVNVYQDEGHAVANRAKVDLDRDDQWDEKWTFADGTVSRQTAPADDEAYTVAEVWQAGAWQ